MEYALSALLGYLLGCSNMALYLSKLLHHDIRQSGSRNLGASNAAIHFGWGAGVTVAVHDIGKALLAVMIAKLLFPETREVGPVAGIAAVLGHMFPFYIRFKGGKGLASYLGVTLALNWKLALAAALLIVVITLVTDYIVLGTFSVAVMVPAAQGFITRDPILVALLLVGTVALFFKHWENIGRMRRGEEIGLRSTAKGENRVDKQ